MSLPASDWLIAIVELHDRIIFCFPIASRDWLITIGCSSTRSTFITAWLLLLSLPVQVNGLILTSAHVSLGRTTRPKRCRS